MTFGLFAPLKKARTTRKGLKENNKPPPREEVLVILPGIRVIFWHFYSWLTFLFLAAPSFAKKTHHRGSYSFSRRHFHYSTLLLQCCLVCKRWTGQNKARVRTTSEGGDDRRQRLKGRKRPNWGGGSQDDRGGDRERLVTFVLISELTNLHASCTKARMGKQPCS